MTPSQIKMSARDNNPTRTGPRRRVGAGAAGRRDRLQGRERQAVHVAKELVEQLERTVPGMVHSLRLDTFNRHLRVDIVLNRNRHSGSGAGEGSAGDDAGPPAGGPEDAPRPRQQRRGSTAGTAAQPTRGRRQPPQLPPTGQQQQQPQPSAAPTTAPPSPRPAADASPAQTASMEEEPPATQAGAIATAAAPAQAGPPFCHTPSPGGRQPRAPTTAVGRAVAYVRDGVRSIAPVIDNVQSYDPQNYFTGAFSIGGTNSQLVTVPKNSVLHKSLAISPSAAGRAIVRAMERSQHRHHDFELERRALLVPEDMMSESGSGDSDSSGNG